MAKKGESDEQVMIFIMDKTLEQIFDKKGGGGNFVWGLFRCGKVRGGDFSPPSGIPKLQLPIAHPNVQVNAVHRAINS